MCRHGGNSAIGFVPTGWTHQTKTESFPVHEKPPWKVHLIPYSEHSSFTELQEFVGFLRPRKIIPTVGVSGDRGEASFHKMAGYFKHLCDNSGALRSFLGPIIAQAATGADDRALLRNPESDKNDATEEPGQQAGTRTVSPREEPGGAGGGPQTVATLATGGCPSEHEEGKPVSQNDNGCSSKSSPSRQNGGDSNHSKV